MALAPPAGDRLDLRNASANAERSQGVRIRDVDAVVWRAAKGSGDIAWFSLPTAALSDDWVKPLCFSLGRYGGRMSGKLVRDRIPEIIREAGRIPVVYTLGDEEFRAALRDKLDEEVTEYLETRRTEELLDILEVIAAIALGEGWTVSDLERLRASKRRERGGFEKRLFLERVEDRGVSGA